MNPFSHPAFHGTFGAARRDITPPADIYSRNWGAARVDTAESIHRPLTLTALYIVADGSKPLALLSLDLGVWRSAEERALFSQAVRDAGIEEGRYLLALTHTHAGPVFCPDSCDKPGGERIRPYLQTVCEAIRQALSEAARNARPGVLEVTTGSCPLASNRDLPDPETGRLLVGWNPALPADETLLLGRVSDDSGNCLATLVNYACHPTILAWENSTLSPDFPGAMRVVVEAGTGAPCLFLQGASGELAPRHQYVGDPAVADRAGRCLGHAALALFYQMQPPGQELSYEGCVESGAPLAIWSLRPRKYLPRSLEAREIVIELPLKKDLLPANGLRQKLKEGPERVLEERLRRALAQREMIGSAECQACTHLLWRLGDILLISVPNEAYSVLQIELRRAAGDRPLLVATVANGSFGYLSPPSSYAADSYASHQSPYVEGCLEQTITALKAAIRSSID